MIISKLLSFEKRFVSIQALLRHNEYRKANYKKKVTLPAKKPLNALCEKRLQSSMFKWTSFYNFMEFHCTILNSYAIYRCKIMVKILNCYLYAKKSYGTLSKGAIFFGQPCLIKNIKFLEHIIKHISNNTNCTAFFFFFVQIKRPKWGFYEESKELHCLTRCVALRWENH